MISKFKSAWWQDKVLKETVNETELQFCTMVFKDIFSYIVNSLGFSDLNILIVFF